jgi:hypothetical protein
MGWDGIRALEAAISVHVSGVLLSLAVSCIGGQREFSISFQIPHRTFMTSISLSYHLTPPHTMFQ